MASTDKELAEQVREAAVALARAMNRAGDAGLLIELEMRAHSSQADTRRVYKRSDYSPVLSISRVLYPLES